MADNGGRPGLVVTHDSWGSHCLSYLHVTLGDENNEKEKIAELQNALNAKEQEVSFIPG